MQRKPSKITQMGCGRAGLPSQAVRLRSLGDNHNLIMCAHDLTLILKREGPRAGLEREKTYSPGTGDIFL